MRGRGRCAPSATTKDGDRNLGHDSDPQRVRKRPVDHRGPHGREPVDALFDDVCVHGDKALAVIAAQLTAHVRGDRRRCTLDANRADREHRGLTCERVQADRHEHQCDAAEK